MTITREQLLIFVRFCRKCAYELRVRRRADRDRDAWNAYQRESRRLRIARKAAADTSASAGGAR